MFKRDDQHRKITMHRGDTGGYRITLVRGSGADFGENDRMLYTINSPSGVKVLQRAYRLDRENANGCADIEFHNEDTEGWTAGTYTIEERCLLNAYWNIANPPTDDVVDLLDMDGAMIDGDLVRTNEPEEAWTLDILNVIGEV